MLELYHGLRRLSSKSSLNAGENRVIHVYLFAVRQFRLETFIPRRTLIADLAGTLFVSDPQKSYPPLIKHNLERS
jgi:hypothetical protein